MQTKLLEKEEIFAEQEERLDELEKQIKQFKVPTHWFFAIKIKLL